MVDFTKPAAECGGWRWWPVPVGRREFKVLSADQFGGSSRYIQEWWNAGLHWDKIWWRPTRWWAYRAAAKHCRKCAKATAEYDESEKLVDKILSGW